MSRVFALPPRSERVAHIMGLADHAYPAGPDGQVPGGHRAAYEDLVEFLNSCRSEDLIVIQAIAYCGAQDYSTYEEALAATVEDQDQYLRRSLAGKRDLADWLRAGLNYIPR